MEKTWTAEERRATRAESRRMLEELDRGQAAHRRGGAARRGDPDLEAGERNQQKNEA